MIWEKGQAPERVLREREMTSRATGFKTKCNQSPEDPSASRSRLRTGLSTAGPFSRDLALKAFELQLPGGNMQNVRLRNASFFHGRPVCPSSSHVPGVVLGRQRPRELAS